MPSQSRRPSTWNTTGTPSITSGSKRQHPAAEAIMAQRKHNIGRIVAGSLLAGLLAAIILVAVPFAGATENVISGAVLVAFGLGWALLAILSTVRTDQPQRWAALPAGVFLVAGFTLIAWPGSVKVVALDWLWPPVSRTGCVDGNWCPAAV